MAVAKRKPESCGASITAIGRLKATIWPLLYRPVVSFSGRDPITKRCEPRSAKRATSSSKSFASVTNSPTHSLIAHHPQVGRFVAPGVKQILFSPQEKYLLTNNLDPRDPQAIKVYEVRTGKLLRAFHLFPDKERQQPQSMDGPPPPPFKWSHDDKYLARQGKDLISVFETPGMRLLNQRSLTTTGIADFQWSPSDNIIAFWAPEADNSPAHVDLIELPARKKIRQKNLFNVTACQMVWHEQGDYLAVKVSSGGRKCGGHHHRLHNLTIALALLTDCTHFSPQVTRHTKSKKTFYNNIELFRLRSPGVPVEMLEIKDAVVALQWEPRGSRFAMIHAENPQAAKVGAVSHGPPPLPCIHSLLFLANARCFFACIPGQCQLLRHAKVGRKDAAQKEQNRHLHRQHS